MERIPFHGPELPESRLADTTVLSPSHFLGEIAVAFGLVIIIFLTFLSYSSQFVEERVAQFA
jgi:flagellar biosynthesis protein FliP